MVSLHEEDDHVVEDKRKGKVQKEDTCWNQKRSEFVIVVGHALLHLASSLTTCRQ